MVIVHVILTSLTWIRSFTCFRLFLSLSACYLHNLAQDCINRFLPLINLPRIIEAVVGSFTSQKYVFFNYWFWVVTDCLSELALVLLVLPHEVVVDVDTVLVEENVISRMVMPEVFPAGSVTRLDVGVMLVRSGSSSFLLGHRSCFFLTGAGDEGIQDTNDFTVRKGLLRDKAVHFGKGSPLDRQVGGHLHVDRAITFLIPTSDSVICAGLAC